MNLLELVEHLSNDKELRDYLSLSNPEVLLSDLDFYLKDLTDARLMDYHSEIVALEFDKTEGDLFLEIDGIKYVYMLSPDELLNIYEGEHKLYNNAKEIANRIIQYVIHDA